MRRGYVVALGIMSAIEGGLFLNHVIVIQVQIWLPKGRMAGEGVSWAQRRETIMGPLSLRPCLKPDLLGPRLG